VVTGPAGVGKSTLALTAAHQVRPDFPDGQLFARLRTEAGTGVDPAEVLGSFLQALGVRGSALPHDLAARADLYQQLLADRRVLVVLDDAADEAQVRPLIPGAAGCTVLVTSRARLGALEGAGVLNLEVLSRDGARRLLCVLAGEDRVLAEGAAADSAIELCGRLPLALRVIGSRLAARPHWTFERLVTALASERHRLDELTVGDLEVRASLQLSYDRLPAPAARAWRLLGTVDAPYLRSWWITALTGGTGTGDGGQDRIVEQLLDDHLLEAVGDDRYRFHELSRLFARERAEREEPAGARTAALTRLAGTYVAVARRADERLGNSFLGEVLPAGADPPLPAGLLDSALADPLGWFAAELASMLALVRQAAPVAPAEAWQLAVALATYLEVRGHLDDWRSSHAAALAAATDTGDLRGQAILHRNLGELHTIQDRYPEAAACFERAVTGFAALGEPSGEAAALSGLGLLHRLTGRHEESLASFGRSLELSRQVGNARGVVYAHSGIGTVYLERGWLAVAETHLRDALTLAHQVGYPAGVATQLRALSLVHCGRGAFTDAEASLREAVALSLFLGDRLGVAHATQWLGVLAGLRGDHDAAARLFGECLAVYRELDNRFGHALALYHLGDLYLTTRRDAAAERYLRDADALWARIGCPYWRARTGDLLAELAERTGGGDRAEEYRATASTLRRSANLPERPATTDPYRPLSLAGQAAGG
jgi:tetratricopeptide (TPR) repeat protein